MTETKGLLDDGPSQLTGSSKSANVFDSLQLTKSSSLPFDEDEREFPTFFNATSEGEFEADREEGESRTGPSTDVSSRAETIIASASIELITSITSNPSTGTSAIDTTPESKTKGISKLGSIIGKYASMKKQRTESTLDDEIMLVREPSSQNLLLSELDDVISRVREGPPVTAIELAEDSFPDDEIFQVREGRPKSSLKKAVAAAKSVRFAFGKKEASEEIDSDRTSMLDLTTLFVDSEDYDDDDEDLDSANSVNKEASTNELAQKTGADSNSEQWRADFLNDLQEQTDYESEAMENTSVDGSSINSLDSTDTDNQSVTMRDCWELACV